MFLGLSSDTDVGIQGELFSVASNGGKKLPHVPAHALFMIAGVQNAQEDRRPVAIQDLFPEDDHSSIADTDWYDPEMEAEWVPPAEDTYGPDPWWRKCGKGKYFQIQCLDSQGLTRFSGPAKKRARVATPDSDGEDELEDEMPAPSSRKRARTSSKKAPAKAGPSGTAPSGPSKSAPPQKARPTPRKKPVPTPVVEDSRPPTPEAGPSRLPGSRSPSPAPPPKSAKALGKQPLAASQAKRKVKGKGRAVRVIAPDGAVEEREDAWEDDSGKPMPKNRHLTIVKGYREEKWQHLAVSAAFCLD